MPGAHRIQLHIAQRGPEMRFVERTGIEASLPHVSAGRLAGIPIRGVASVALLERLRPELATVRGTTTRWT